MQRLSLFWMNRGIPKDVFGESTEFNNLDISFPPDTIQVVTYLSKILMLVIKMPLDWGYIFGGGGKI